MMQILTFFKFFSLHEKLELCYCIYSIFQKRFNQSHLSIKQLCKKDPILRPISRTPFENPILRTYHHDSTPGTISSIPTEAPNPKIYRLHPISGPIARTPFSGPIIMTQFRGQFQFLISGSIARIQYRGQSQGPHPEATFSEHIVMTHFWGQSHGPHLRTPISGPFFKIHFRANLKDPTWRCQPYSLCSELTFGANLTDTIWGFQA